MAALRSRLTRVRGVRRRRATREGGSAASSVRSVHRAYRRAEGEVTQGVADSWYRRAESYSPAPITSQRPRQGIHYTSLTACRLGSWYRYGDSNPGPVAENHVS